MPSLWRELEIVALREKSGASGGGSVALVKLRTNLRGASPTFVHPPQNTLKGTMHTVHMIYCLSLRNYIPIMEKQMSIVKYYVARHATL